MARTRRPGRPGRPKIVLLGMLTRIPVGGVAWLVGQYAMGFERLGFDVYYVEAHARTPSMLMRDEHDDATARACAFLDAVMRRFGLGDRWAFHALHDDGSCHGLGERQVRRLYRDAALIVNLHGGTVPLPEHTATGRLVYLGTDPVDLELELHRGRQRSVDFLEQHTAYFTWGLNAGNPDCTLPWSDRFPFTPSPPPVVVDQWDNDADPVGAPFTTIGNWRQDFRDLRFEGEVLSWSKHHEFLKVIDLPSRVGAPLELALSSYTAGDRRLLESHGWRVRPALEVSADVDSYRAYVVASAGELSVAKEQNVHFRTGWFSERSAMYLAAGRPVVLQDTGFGNALPTGDGLFAFADADEAADAVDAVERDPKRHRRAARDVAHDYLAHDVVLGALLDHVGLAPARAARPPRRPSPRHSLGDG
ncbi:MAG: hypothetical protein ACRD0G_08625, partial [Acidimicrobiales bacterium]